MMMIHRFNKYNELDEYLGTGYRFSFVFGYWDTLEIGFNTWNYTVKNLHRFFDWYFYSGDNSMGRYITVVEVKLGFISVIRYFEDEDNKF